MKLQNTHTQKYISETKFDKICTLVNGFYLAYKFTQKKNC